MHTNFLSLVCPPPSPNNNTRQWALKFKVLCCKIYTKHSPNSSQQQNTCELFVPCRCSCCWCIFWFLQALQQIFAILYCLWFRHKQCEWGYKAAQFAICYAFKCIDHEITGVIIAVGRAHVVKRTRFFSGRKCRFHEKLHETCLENLQR